MIHIAAVLIIGMIILIHEAGHLLAAKLAGISIATFSIGFGPKIAAPVWRGTEYRLSAVPLGGYVMPAMESEEDYFRIPPIKRIIMSLGGPLANLAAAVLLYGVLNGIKGEGGFFSLLIAPFVQTGILAFSMIAALPSLFSVPESLSGVVGIVSSGGAFMAGGWVPAVKFSILMSVNLAVLNLLPLPVLDGGKIVLFMLEWIHPRMRAVHVPLAITGWVLIGGLTLYVTASDIVKLFS